jgi:aspartate/glutamate racemase
MKKIGIVAVSAGDPRRITTQASASAANDGTMPGTCQAFATPEIGIESLDLATAVSYLGTNGDEESWAQFDGYHRAALERLEASGADFALIASTRRTIGSPRFGIPVINIFDEAAKQSARSGARQVPILGTPLTMTSPGFRAAFARYGAAAAGPAAVVARAMTAGGLS